MLPVRVLLGELPSSLQSAITQVIQSHVDVEVVGVVTQPTELLLAAGPLHADVVLLEMVDGGLPGVASHLLDQYPDIKVMAIAPDGSHALSYALRPQVARLRVASAEELVKMIRLVVQLGTE